MSTYGVRTRFVALLAGSGGAVSAAAYAALVDYAAERGYTPGELRAILRPADYLEASRAPAAASSTIVSVPSAASCRRTGSAPGPADSAT